MLHRVAWEGFSLYRNHRYRVGYYESSDVIISVSYHQNGIIYTFVSEIKNHRI